MEFSWYQQEVIKEEDIVSVPQTEAKPGVSEDADIVETKARLLENLRLKLEKVEEEADALRQAVEKQEREILAAQGVLEGRTGGSTVAVKLEPEPKVEVKVEIKEEPKDDPDTRSIFVGNVDYACTAEEVQQHFLCCGTINRVAIMTDKFGQPKGFAYVEFEEYGAVHKALLLNETELHARQLKVSVKRTNYPGLNLYRGRRHYGYGSFPRFKRPMRYNPY